MMNILGITEFKPSEALESWESPEDAHLSMDIDPRLDKLQYFADFSQEDLYHVIGHEGIHGEWFQKSYGTENRERGMPIPTMMALHGAMKADGDALEAATEYTARKRNPEFDDATIRSYEREVAELERELEKRNADLSDDREEIYEGSDKIRGVDIHYSDADVDYFLEHGSIGDEEYVLALGDDGSYEPYLEWLEEQYEQMPDVFEFESPLNGSGRYEMPDMGEFKDYVVEKTEQEFDEYDRYSPDEGFDDDNWYADVVVDDYNEGMSAGIDVEDPGPSTLGEPAV